MQNYLASKINSGVDTEGKETTPWSGNIGKSFIVPGGDLVPFAIIVMLLCLPPIVGYRPVCVMDLNFRLGKPAHTAGVANVKLGRDNLL